MGQPLRAEIELLAVQADELNSIEAKLASAEAFRRARMERSGVAADVQLTIDKRANGQPVVRVTSATPVSDPFVDLLIELTWSSGRILREYTILLDPVREAKPVAEAARPMPAVTAPSSSRDAAAAPPTLPTAKPTAKAAAAPAKPATYGPVKPGETLHSIARKVILPDVTLEMMVASLYQVNKNAFSRGNVNLLREGKLLTVPDRDSVMQMFSPHQAHKLLSEHAEAWQEIRGRVATEAARTLPEAADGAGKGKIVPAKPEEKVAPAGDAKDVLKLSKGEPAKTPDAKAAQRVQALEEEVAAKSHALQEAKDRVSQLERTVQDLQHLLDLKGKEAGKPAAPVETKPEPAAATPPAEPAKATPPAEPAKTKAPVEVPVQTPSFISSLLATPLYLGGIVAAVVLAILLWIMMVGSRRRKNLSEFEQSVMTGGDPFKTSIFKTGEGAGSERGATTQSGVATDFSRLGLGSIDTHEVDPIAEAEVYMAYGRDAQAEEILKEALGKDPHRHEVSLKLLEIYAGRQDKAGFETQASELYAALGNPSSPVWHQAAEMGRKLDPDNPLYRVVSEIPSLPDAIPEPPVPEPPMPEPEPEPETAAPEELVFDLPAAPELAAEPAAPVAQDVGELHLDGLDFSLDQVATTEAALAAAPEFPSFGTLTEAEAAPAEEIELPAFSSEGALELPEEIELIDLAAEAVPEQATEQEQALQLPDLDFSGIDLDLSEPEKAIEAAPVVEAAETIDPDLLEEVNTKLDLARAYLEMGDKEGAREILEEVAKEGSAQQRQEAERLIAGL